MAFIRHNSMWVSILYSRNQRHFLGNTKFLLCGETLSEHYTTYGYRMYGTDSVQHSWRHVAVNRNLYFWNAYQSSHRAEPFLKHVCVCVCVCQIKKSPVFAEPEGSFLCSEPAINLYLSQFNHDNIPFPHFFKIYFNVLLASKAVFHVVSSGIIFYLYQFVMVYACYMSLSSFSPSHITTLIIIGRCLNRETLPPCHFLRPNVSLGVLIVG